MAIKKILKKEVKPEIKQTIKEIQKINNMKNEKCIRCKNDMIIEKISGTTKEYFCLYCGSKLCKN